MRVGSLFTGIGGLDLGVGGEPVWHSEIDPVASRVLEHRFLGVPNLGDITMVDWGSVPPVDLLVGGFPCQDISTNGLGAGINGSKSGLWFEMLRAITELRPQYVLALRKRGLDVVLRGLADEGYDAVWSDYSSAQVGAPHIRRRLFVVAYARDRAEGPTIELVAERPGAGVCAPVRGSSITAEGLGNHVTGAWDTDPDLRESLYYPCVARWQQIIGVAAPPPRDDRGMANVRFIEWMMGFPSGWVDLPGVGRASQWRMLGNAVQPQTARLAWDTLGEHVRSQLHAPTGA